MPASFVAHQSMSLSASLTWKQWLAARRLSQAPREASKKLWSTEKRAFWFHLIRTQLPIFRAPPKHSQEISLLASINSSRILKNAGASATREDNAWKRLSVGPRLPTKRSNSIGA